MPRPEASGADGRRAIRRVLAIRHRAGGDLLLSTPAFHALKRALPDASIEVLTARAYAELLEGNADIDRLLLFDRRSIPSQLALYARLARGGYDLVLDMVSNPRSAFMTRLTRAPARIGYDLPGRRHAYTRAIPREPVGAGRALLRYAPEAALDLVRAAGLPAAAGALRFQVGAAAQRRADEWIRAAGVPADRSLIVCLPSGSWPAKTWPAERFVAALDALAGEGSVVWSWGPGEEGLARACRDGMRSRSWVAPPAGWQDLGALIRRAGLWIGNDSGPKHLAVALGVPTVTIFGPTHPATWHPPAGPHVAIWAEGLDCLHCNANVCPLEGGLHMRCMRDLPVERVIAAARGLLARAAKEDRCASR